LMSITVPKSQEIGTSTLGLKALATVPHDPPPAALGAIVLGTPA
jgi:hypothetical protein